MFIDQVRLNIKAGTGGDGVVAFRREKFVPMGGPAGGSGGRGGNVIFMADEGLSTLLELKYNKIVEAQPGEKGMSKGMHGKNAEDKYVKVPVGTTIYDNETGLVMADLVDHQQQFIAARAGRGGKGNMQFASSRNPAPEIAEKGEPGERREVRLELKLLADVGLVGFPSVGKSTLISVVSKAKPKIASYHFTTIQPNLGVVSTRDNRSFVMADLPGIIEGASQGTGLGLQFLRHIERTRVILHVIDMSCEELRDPYNDYCIINKELESYKYNLLKRPQIVVANKMDHPDAKDNLEVFKSQLKENNIECDIVEISAITSDNLDELLYKTADLLEITDKFALFEDDELESVVEYNFVGERSPFDINLGDDGIFVVTGEKLYKLFEMTDFTNDVHVRKFSKILRGMGVDEELRRKGVKDGDVVRIFDYEFEFID